MICDQPFVSYNKSKDKKSSKKDMDSFADAWAAKKAKEKENGEDNPFASFSNAKKTSMREFFNSNQ